MEEQLIDEVRARPCLYDRRHKNYSRRDIQKNNWDEIAAKLGETTGKLSSFCN